MGKGDKKSRRGKIILGSSGVRRPKASKIKNFVASGIDAKVAKVAETVKPEAKTKAKVTAPDPGTDTVIAAKTVKKAVKKPATDDTPA